MNKILGLLILILLVTCFNSNYEFFKFELKFKNKFKLLIGQNSLDEFNKYKSSFEEIKDYIFGGSIYISQPTSTVEGTCYDKNKQQIDNSPICPYPGNWNAGIPENQHGENNNWGERNIQWQIDNDNTVMKYLKNIISGNNQYCQVAIGFKYCGMGNSICFSEDGSSTKNIRASTYEKYLDNWSNKTTGDFSYIIKIANKLKSLSESNFNLTWLFRFEYEVAIDKNQFGDDYINVRKKYCKAFLNCRQKMFDIFKEKKNRIKFIFHPVVGDSMKDCDGISNYENCDGKCVWNDYSTDKSNKINCQNDKTNKKCECRIDPNRKDETEADWINLFKKMGPDTLAKVSGKESKNNYLPDLFGQSQVFGLKEQYNMAIDNFKMWKLRTQRETIFSETSVTPINGIDCGNKSELSCGNDIESEKCTSLQDLMNSIIKENCVDYLVYINTDMIIAETNYCSAIEKNGESIKNTWVNFIKNYAKKN